MQTCPCGSGQSFSDCCEPVISGTRAAATAEALMRARYSAYASGRLEFLGESLHPEHRKDYDPEATRRWARDSSWLSLEIRSTDGGGVDDQEGRVEFVASYREKGAIHRHHEVSQFLKLDGTWYFVDGTLQKPETQTRVVPKVGRNDPCPCGSGKKFKKCCGS
jgi:SEC-C motif-containing protein